ncbi:MAG: hypothetical protein ACREX9_06330 [Gammaproteobacteria bacterium]
MAPLVADAVLTWLERAVGRRTVVFCVDIKHSAWLTHQFKANGVAAEHVHANTVTAERDAIFAFRVARFKYSLTAYWRLTDWDLPTLSCIVPHTEPGAVPAVLARWPGG